MSSREEFEAWLSSEYPWGNEALDKAFFSGNDDNGYYTGGDFIYDGSSCADALFWAWRGWQESHKQGKARCAALAAESQAVKAMNDCLSEELRGYESDGAFEGPKMHLLWWKVQTPATNSFLAELRAQGVDLAIAELNQLAERSEKDAPVGAGHHRSAALFLQLISTQLRKGASA